MSASDQVAVDLLCAAAKSLVVVGVMNAGDSLGPFQCFVGRRTVSSFLLRSILVGKRSSKQDRQAALDLLDSHAGAPPHRSRQAAFEMALSGRSDGGEFLMPIPGER